MKLDDATTAQNDAANPGISTWLSANAGSGKTRVLTDRVARLLLAGTDPQNILCLTYTKAAAGEMQNRLFTGLGSWAMLTDQELRENLERIGEVPPEDLSHARTLFARAVETPGGLKIQTIHSFCASLLRQFPLEAGVSPGFRELDDAAQKTIVESVLDQLISTRGDVVAPLARLYGGESLTTLASKIAQDRGAFQRERTRIDVLAAYGLSETQTQAAALASVERVLQGDWWSAFLDTLSGLTPAYQRDAALLRSIRPTSLDDAAFAILRKIFLYAKSSRPKVGTYPQANHTTAAEATAPWRAELDTLSEAISSALETFWALESSENTLTLDRFAVAFLEAYRAEKDRSGVLDFDDLIDRAKNLLTDRSLDWVLYRLDGRIDHILVDEAQDTSPGQWSVIGALADEIAAGQGAERAQERTLFVVGDKKQSIYSFQGADAQAFDRMAEHFKHRMSSGLVRSELLYSFRSSPAILEVVDATFEDVNERALGKGVQHRAFHPDKPGRVDLWPLQERESLEEPPPWYDPVDRVSAGDPSVLLANRLAEEIQRILNTETIQGKNGEVRQVSPGDILVLVQRRSTLFDQIIRACKQLELPTAGADRLKINAALAVKDLTALLSFMALPEDDLSLAAALKSPLFGWTERDLFSLAAGRNGAFLWQTLRDRRDEFSETVEILDVLRSKADFERPFELLELILGQFDGRRNLVKRLGAEAEDGIDELLSHAVRYEQRAVPSLTGFLAQLSAEELEIKRATDPSDDLIRVMTIHGAKGLEAPIVILPDTVRRSGTKLGDFVITEGGEALWNEPSATSPRSVTEAKEAEAEAADEERQRLLYVAMTRAESWLIVAGVEPGQRSKTRQWHEIVEDGMVRAGAVWSGEGDARILRYERGQWPTAAEIEATVSKKSPDEGTQKVRFGAIPDPTATFETVAPSALGGAKALAGDGGLSEEEAMARGSEIHRLLEHLPPHDPDGWVELGRTLLGPGLSEDALAERISEASRCIARYPDLFGPDFLSEVDLAAYLPSIERTLDGTIDRLLIRETGIEIIDYKTNATRPSTAKETPEGVLRQLGAYLEAVQSIWPDQPIKLSILWTVDATLMEIPHDLVTEALTRVARS